MYLTILYPILSVCKYTIDFQIIKEKFMIGCYSLFFAMGKKRYSATVRVWVSIFA